ncbi:MAG TPA: Gfo/Idh/MocA family oxidoreductase [Rhizomicrobium sp.]
MSGHHRIGICGFGRMGRIRADAVEQHGGAEIVKIFDTVYQGDEKYPKAPSIDAIVNDPAIDSVFVCLPNFLNKSTTIAALKAGKNVFCEKPPAFTADDMREIMEAEKQSGKVLMYGFNHRHHAALIKMKAYVDSGQFGRVLWMRGRYGKSVDSDYFTGWRAKQELAGGGILLDQGIHMLDLMLYLSGSKFDEVHALVSNLYWKTPGIEDNVFAIMRNSDTGLCASLHSTMTQWRHLFSLEVFLERGYMVLNGLKTSSGTYGDEELSVAKNRSKAPAATWEDEERFRYPVDESWQREVTQFLESVANGAAVRSGSSQQALDVMELIGAIYRHDRHESKELFESLPQNPR